MLASLFQKKLRKLRLRQNDGFLVKKCVPKDVPDNHVKVTQNRFTLP